MPALRLVAALALSVAALPALAGGLGEMTPAERDAFGAEVRAYLLAHPEVLIEVMDELKAREQAAADQLDGQLVETHKAAIFDDGTSWVGGNPEGDVTVVEFMDYRCGYCRKAFDEVEELVKSDGNIRFVVKEFPILGEESVISARFAVAVLQLGGPEAYKKAHDALITLRGSPDEAALSQMAADLGLEAPAVLARMQSDEVTAVIAANHALAEELQISGTPTFVLGGRMLRGYVPLQDMQALVAEAREG